MDETEKPTGAVMKDLPSEIISYWIDKLSISSFFSFSQTCRENRDIAHVKLFELTDDQSKKAQQRLLHYWYKNPVVLYKRDLQTRRFIYKNLKSLLQRSDFQSITGYACLTLLSVFNKNDNEIQQNFIRLAFFSQFSSYILFSVLEKINVVYDNENRFEQSQCLEGLINLIKTDMQSNEFEQLITKLSTSHSLFSPDEIFTIVMQLLNIWLDDNNQNSALFDNNSELEDNFINLLTQASRKLTPDHVNQVFLYLDKILKLENKNEDRQMRIDVAFIINIFCKKFNADQILRLIKNFLKDLLIDIGLMGKKLADSQGEDAVSLNNFSDLTSLHDVCLEIFLQCDSNVSRSILIELSNLYLASFGADRLNHINVYIENISEKLKNSQIPDSVKEEILLSLKFFYIPETPKLVFSLIGKNFSLRALKNIVPMLLMRKSANDVIMPLLVKCNDLEKIFDNFWSWNISEQFKICFLCALAEKIHEMNGVFPIQFSEQQADRLFIRISKDFTILYKPILKYLAKYISNSLAKQQIEFFIKCDLTAKNDNQRSISKIFEQLATRITEVQAEEFILIILENIRSFNSCADIIFLKILISNLPVNIIQSFIPAILKLQEDGFDVVIVIEKIKDFLIDNQKEKSIEINLAKIIDEDDQGVAFRNMNLLGLLGTFSDQFSNDNVNSYFNYLLANDRKDCILEDHIELVSLLLNRFSSEQLIALYGFRQCFSDEEYPLRKLINDNAYRIDYEKLKKLYLVVINNSEENLQQADKLFQSVFNVIQTNSQEWMCHVITVPPPA